MYTLDYYRKNQGILKKYADTKLCEFLDQTQNIDEIGILISSFIIDLYPDFLLSHAVPPSQPYNMYDLGFIASLVDYMETRAAEITVAGLVASDIAGV